MWLDKLREMKNESGLTTKEIAHLSKIPEPTLEKIFSGATKDPKLETMRQLVVRSQSCETCSAVLEALSFQEKPETAMVSGFFLLINSDITEQRKT